jgi:hypothetical protein
MLYVETLYRIIDSILLLVNLLTTVAVRNKTYYSPSGAGVSS